MYERFVASYLRLLGWDVEEMERHAHVEDPGDLVITLGDWKYTVDVKENQQWVRPKSLRDDWLPWPYVPLTSDDQYHHGWLYVSVATDFHAMAFVFTHLFDESELVFKENTKKNGVMYQMVAVPKKYAKPYLVHISARPNR